MNYREQEFIARRLEFVLSHEHIKNPSKTELSKREDYRNIFSHVKKAALGRYLNLLIENKVLDIDDLEDAFLEVARTNNGFNETLTSDEEEQWYITTAVSFRNWVNW